MFLSAKSLNEISEKARNDIVNNAKKYLQASLRTKMLEIANKGLCFGIYDEFSVDEAFDDVRNFKFRDDSNIVRHFLRLMIYEFQSETDVKFEFIERDGKDCISFQWHKV